VSDAENQYEKSCRLCHATTTLLCASLSREKSYAHGTACSVELNALCTRATGALMTTFATFSNTSADKMRNHAKNSAHRFYIGGLGVSTHLQRAAVQNCHQASINAQLTRKYTVFHRGKEPEMAHMPRITSSACTSNTTRKGAGSS